MSSIMFFDTGDLVDGTGWSDAIPDYHGKYILPIVQKIPFDGMTIGNHDLGRNEVIDAIANSLAPESNGTYITSNTLFVPEKSPLGASYHVHTTLTGARVLVLGFIYNFEQAANDSLVIHVTLSMQKTYFKNAMSEPDITMVVVLNHIAPQPDGKYNLLQHIQSEIRRYRPHTPIILLSGHSHVNYFQWYDDNSFTLESGCYFQELGRLRFSLDESGRLTNDTFSYDYVPTSRDRFYEIVEIGADRFVTPTGYEIKKDIAAIWTSLNLGEKIGCSPTTYDTTLGLDDPASAYGLLLNEMVPKVLFDPKNNNNTQFFLSSTGFLRYNLYEGPVVVNDVWTMCGFNDSYMVFKGMDGAMLQSVITALDNLPPMAFLSSSRMCAQRLLADQPLPYFITSNLPVTPGTLYDVVMNSYDAGTVSNELVKLNPTVPPAKLPQPVWYSNTISDTNMIFTYVQRYLQGSC